jgi:DNA repair exonuclease SbcCD ATPase subunit
MQLSSLKLTKITLKNFGSYENETVFDLTTSPLLIFGDTGCGKSSIIEGIFMCLTGGDTKD